MGKHSKNNNDRPFFSNAERKAAAYGRHASSMLGGHNTGANFTEWGWGTETRTLDSDSMKDIDACSLTLQPCATPLVSPSGVLYDKQALIEYILARKKEIERETKAWEAQQQSDERSVQAAAAATQQSRIEEFVAQQEGLSQADLRARAAAAVGSASSSSGGGGSGSSKSVVSAAYMGRVLLSDQGKHAADTSFWAPSQTPDAKHRLEKPDSVVRCPITNEPLRLKAMLEASFTPAHEGDEHEALVGKAANERYICPLTKKALSNVNPACVLRPSGKVVSLACVKDFIKKDMIDPFTDPPTKLREKDIIELRCEGTGFAARTKESALKVTTAKPYGF